MDKDKAARQMLEVFHEHCSIWAKRYDDLEDNPPIDPYFDEDSLTGGLYYKPQVTGSMEPTNTSTTTVLWVFVNTSDELHGFDLMGVFEEDSLIYLTACVDTMWDDVWRGSYPTGLIDTSKPYVREGEFLSLPEENSQTNL